LIDPSLCYIESRGKSTRYGQLWLLKYHRDNQPPIESRIEESIEVRHAPGWLGRGYLVSMTQPLRGLIPTLPDGQAAEPMVAGTRLQALRRSPNGPLFCRHPS
jgi:hypothetical protein